MMRTLGIPTRVAVGFTSGVQLGDGEYSVLGRNAHAWPEVWFDGIGWVAVRADARPWRPERRELHRAAAAAGRPRPAADEGDAETPGHDAAGRSDSTQALGWRSPTSRRSEHGDTRRRRRPRRPPTTAATSWQWLACGLAAARRGARLRRASSGSSAHRRRDAVGRRAARRRRGNAPPSAVAARSASHCSPSDTPSEIAASTARHFPLVTRPMASLADAVTEATYRAERQRPDSTTAGAYGSSTIAECRHWAKQIDRAATESHRWPGPGPPLLHRRGR